MFCIFPNISLPCASYLKLMEKGLHHFSFSDVFRFFEISGHVSLSENSQATGLAVLLAPNQLSNDDFEGTDYYF